jgi:hypothetical protein
VHDIIELWKGIIGIKAPTHKSREVIEESESNIDSRNKVTEGFLLGGGK